MWLPDLDIKFGRGLLVTLLLFFATHLFFEGALRLGVDPNAGSLQKTLILIGVLALEAALVLLVISRIGRIDIRRLFFGKLPSWRELLGWGFVASAAAFFHFASHLKYGYRWEEMGYAFFAAGIVLEALMFPLIEEPIYRGICFVALYNYNRRNAILAYLGSTLFFTMAHAASFSELILHATLGLGGFHLFFIICFSLLSAYIYHSTGKLLLCIWVHGIINSIKYVGVLVGSWAGVAPPIRQCTRIEKVSPRSPTDQGKAFDT